MEKPVVFRLRSVSSGVQAPSQNPSHSPNAAAFFYVDALIRRDPLAAAALLELDAEFPAVRVWPTGIPAENLKRTLARAL